MTPEHIVLTGQNYFSYRLVSAVLRMALTGKMFYTIHSSKGALLMEIRIGGVYLSDNSLLTKDEIEPKDIFWLYAIAIEGKIWIEAISLGYTIIEISLKQLMRSNAQGHPTIPESRINQCNYLIQLAKLARDEKIIDQSLYDKIDQFNKVRRAAIHRLAEGRTKKSEIQSAAHSVTDCLSEFQQLLGIKITVGHEERNPDFKG